MKHPSPNEVVAAIEAGVVPLDRVFEAANSLIERGLASIEWVLDLDKLPGLRRSGELTADTMTLDEMAQVAAETGVGWDGINPITDARVARSILMANVAAHGGDLDAVGKLTIGDVVDAFSQRERKSPPDPS